MAVGQAPTPYHKFWFHQSHISLLSHFIMRIPCLSLSLPLYCFEWLFIKIRIILFFWVSSQISEFRRLGLSYLSRWLKNQMEWDSDSNLSCGDEVADDGWFGGDSGTIQIPASSLPTPFRFVSSADSLFSSLNGRSMLGNELYRGSKVRCLCGAVSSSGFLGAKSVAFRTHMYGRTVMIAVDKIPVYDSAEDELTSKPSNLGVLRMSTRYLFVA
ncbi:unnamed protein product [Eruca vesicaria subsp. sativa]|uniref:Uncharacterized protein n=1 Tax=Eruca vesicaria subsp. sativa TaxID=29727 RepID=A0ABC8JD41_ERUVS|nr:unnamed protein product [Eruca vesicaria subsp. sativa]